MISEKERTQREIANYKETQLAERRERKIIESNVMAQAANDMTTIKEVQVLYILLSQVDTSKPSLEPVRMPLKYMLDIMGMNHGGANYRLLKDTLQRLRSRSWWIVSEENGYRKETLNSYIDTVTIIDRSSIEVKFSSSLEEHYLKVNNKKNFAQLTLEPMLVMGSHWATNLYRYLTSEAFKREITVSIKRLRASINCEKYKQYRDFKNKVLKPSVEKINLYAYINVEMVENRIGRTVESITFFMYPKTPAERMQAHLRAKQILDRMMLQPPANEKKSTSATS